MPAESVGTVAGAHSWRQRVPHFRTEKLRAPNDDVQMMMMMMMMMKLPILPFTEKLELVLSTAPKT